MRKLIPKDIKFLKALIDNKGKCSYGFRPNACHRCIINSNICTTASAYSKAKKLLDDYIDAILLDQDSTQTP